VSRLERHESRLPSVPPALPWQAASADVARYRVPPDRTLSSSTWSAPSSPAAPPTRARLGVGLAAAAIAVFVAGSALRATLTAPVSSPPGQAEQALRAAGMAAPGQAGAHSQGSPRPVPKGASGAPNLTGSVGRLPNPGAAQERRVPDLRQGSEGTGPGPRDGAPPLDPADAWNAAVSQPWWVPLRPVPFAAEGTSAAPVTGMPGPAANAGSGSERQAVLLVVEYNATDGDAAVQAFFDGPAWTRIRIVGPTGRTIVERTNPLGVSGLDLTESVPEDQEPTLVQLLQMFPPGDYSFKGTTVGGAMLEATGTLSYDLPDPAVIVAIDPSVPTIAWTWVPGLRSRIRELAGFQVILENAREVTVSFDLDPLTTSLAVPAEFLEPGTAYRVDVLAIAANGNRTVTETAFVTPGRRR
jgi:hypothetical protein